jgi:phosphoribosylanthranilate isomerase
VTIGVKVCGLTRVEDVALADSLGAQFVGFNFSSGSPRRVDPGRARELASAAGNARRVGIFVGESPEEIRRAIDAAGLDLIQVHRDVAAGDFEHGVPVVAVCRVFGGAARWPDEPLLARSLAILFDTGDPERHGGTGRPFDWRMIEGRAIPVPVWLAGGLTAANVGEAIRRVRPAVVDVASGVESSPGVKDAGRLREFFEAVADAA